MNGWTGGGRDRQEWMNGRTEMGRQTDGWRDGQKMDGWMDEGGSDGRMLGWKDFERKGGNDGWTDRGKARL